jgi:hypothetical protein
MVSRLISSRLFLTALLIASLGSSSLVLPFQKTATKATTKQTATDTAATDDSSDNDTRGLKPREYAQQLNVRIAGRRTNSSAIGKGKKSPSSFVAKVNTNTEKPLAKGEDVGVTLWLLSEAAKTDDKEVQEKTRIAVRKNGKETEQEVVLTPKRASSDMVFQDGNILRFSLESPFEGYVYIINREKYGDNDYSDPYLIYPSKRDVGVADKGRPDQTLFIPNDSGYFELKKLSENQKAKQAEVFHVIISKTPLAELPPLDNDEPRKVDAALFEKWRKDWNTGTTEFEQKLGKGTSIKQAEKAASVAKKGRLKETDPLPQTVYHVTSNSQNALIFEVQIKIKS